MTTGRAERQVDPATGATEPLAVVAAAIVQEERLLVVSKRAAPDVFYLPGGKPDAGAELADLRWVSGHERDVHLAPAVQDHVLPLLRHSGLLAQRGTGSGGRCGTAPPPN